MSTSRVMKSLESLRKYLLDQDLRLVLCGTLFTFTSVRSLMEVIVCIELVQKNLETTAYPDQFPLSPTSHRVGKSSIVVVFLRFEYVVRPEDVGIVSILRTVWGCEDLPVIRGQGGYLVGRVPASPQF